MNQIKIHLNKSHIFLVHFRWKRRPLSCPSGQQDFRGHGKKGCGVSSRVLCRQHLGEAGRPSLYWLLCKQRSRLWCQGKNILLVGLN